jgi:hypothetical protein
MDPYERLELRPGASEQQVNKAFRRLARRYHPDKFPDPIEKRHAESVFKQLVEARDAILSGAAAERAPRARPAPAAKSATRARAGSPAKPAVRRRTSIGVYALLSVAFFAATAALQASRPPAPQRDPKDVKLHMACTTGVVAAERVLAPKAPAEDAERHGGVLCESVLRDFKARPGGLDSIHGDPVELFCAIGINETFKKYGFGRETHTTLSERAQLAFEHCTAVLAIQTRH